MERLVKGDVVVLPFPFADLTETKRRPAMIVARADANAVILCQITSQIVNDPDAIQLGSADFESGSLKKLSNIWPNRLFTADERVISYRAGHLKSEKTFEVVERIAEILRR
ncbi:MAG: type II toxin-antitoxin system PemK/MazF family toxin [Thermoguttaceae bacterium]|jgi:mRNA interferase MazF